MIKTFGQNYTLVMTGEEVVQKNLARIALGHQTAFNSALVVEGEGIYNASQPLVPVDTGALKKSGKVKSGNEHKSDPTSFVVAIGYGARNKNPKNKKETKRYARYQHETNPTNPKYLERPAMKAVSGMAERIATRMKGVQE